MSIFFRLTRTKFIAPSSRRVTQATDEVSPPIVREAVHLPVEDEQRTPRSATNDLVDGLVTRVWASPGDDAVVSSSPSIRSSIGASTSPEDTHTSRADSPTLAHARLVVLPGNFQLSRTIICAMTELKHLLNILIGDTPIYYCHLTNQRFSTCLDTAASEYQSTGSSSSILAALGAATRGIWHVQVDAHIAHVGVGEWKGG